MALSPNSSGLQGLDSAATSSPAAFHCCLDDTATTCSNCVSAAQVAQLQSPKRHRQVCALGGPLSASAPFLPGASVLP